MPTTPNNFKVTDAIGETDNYIGAEAQFFHITLVADDSSVVDLRTELGYDDCTQYNKDNITAWYYHIPKDR